MKLTHVSDERDIPHLLLGTVSISLREIQTEVCQERDIVELLSDSVLSKERSA